MADDEDIPADPSTLIRLGRVTSVTLSPPRCQVRFGDPDDDDADTETPPIRWLNGRAGKTRRWSPPSEGEEVVLLSPDGQMGNAVALLGLSNDDAPPPSDQDQDWTEYDDGAKISYDPATHALIAELPGGSSARIVADDLTIVGNVRIEGKLDVTGKIASDDDVLAGSIALKTHRHGGVSAGGTISGQPV